MTPEEAELEHAGRLLDREGVAMVLALVDETGAAPPVTDERMLADGAGQAALLESYRAALRRDAAADDAAAVQDVVAVFSHAHRPRPIDSPPGRAPARPAGPAGSADPPGPAGHPGPACHSEPAGRSEPAGLPEPAGVLPSFGQHAAALRAGRLLRVVNYHNTPVSRAAELEAELAGYLAAYDPVTPADLESFLDTGVWPLARPGFVAAFYDGYRNHATVAAPVCDRLGITGWFLPPTAFLATPPADQPAFADAHDMWVLEEELAQDRLALSFEELAEISQRHVVVAHTATHAATDQAATPADLHREVVAPRADIERVTGRAPAGMVWRLGSPYDPAHPSSRAVRDAGYRFVISNTAIQRIAESP